MLLLLVVVDGFSVSVILELLRLDVSLLTLPGDIAGVGAGADDFVALENLKVEFKAIDDTKKVYVNIVSDTKQEGFEWFDVKVYKDAANTTLANNGSGTDAVAQGYIKDEWAPTYNYTITSNAGDEASA